MPRPNRIWYRKSRKEWCVKIDGRLQRLGPDKSDARRRFHELMAQKETPSQRGSLAEMLDDFLDYIQETGIAPGTLRWYQDYIQQLIDFLKTEGIQPGVVSPTTLQPNLVRQWAKLRGRSTRGPLTAIKAAYRWAKQEDIITNNPVENMKKPMQKSRQQIISQEEFDQILAHSPDQAFRDLLNFSWEIGCRPQESKALESQYVDLKNGRCVLPIAESKGQERPRVIYLTPEAIKIVKRLMKQHGEGKLFRNTRNKPWTASAVKCRFARLAEKLGVRYTQYAFRHSFCHRGLKNGVDAVTMATLMGRKSPAMVANVYSHLSQDPEFLRNAAKKVAK